MSKHDALIAAIRELPAALEAVVSGLTAEQLTTPFLDGEWTVAQNVHHVADSHMTAYLRTKLILNADFPLLQGYDQNRWAEASDAVGADLSASLVILRGLHPRWADVFAALSDEDLARTGNHTENGSVTLLSMLEYYSQHGAGHIEQIRRTLAAENR